MDYLAAVYERLPTNTPPLFVKILYRIATRSKDYRQIMDLQFSVVLCHVTLYSIIQCYAVLCNVILFSLLSNHTIIMVRCYTILYQSIPFYPVVHFYHIRSCTALLAFYPLQCLVSCDPSPPLSFPTIHPSIHPYYFHFFSFLIYSSILFYYFSPLLTLFLPSLPLASPPLIFLFSSLLFSSLLFPFPFPPHSSLLFFPIPSPLPSSLYRWRKMQRDTALSPTPKHPCSLRLP